MMFFSNQKGIAKDETKSYKRWKIALCHTENELCIEVVQRVRWREDATTVWTVGQERRGAGLLVRCFRNVRDRDTEI